MKFVAIYPQFIVIDEQHEKQNKFIVLISSFCADIP